MSTEQYLEYCEFTSQLSKAVQIAKPRLSCHFEICDRDAAPLHFDEKLPAHDTRGKLRVAGEWYVVVTPDSGCRYYINVSKNSLLTMAKKVFGQLEALYGSAGALTAK